MSSYNKLKEALKDLRKNPSLIDSVSLNELYARLGQAQGYNSAERNKELLGIPDPDLNVLRGQIGFNELAYFNSEDGSFNPNGPMRTDYAKALSFIEEAKEGVSPKFKARRGTEDYYKMTVDRPGMRQTRSADSLLSASGALLQGPRFSGTGRGKGQGF